MATRGFLIRFIDIGLLVLFGFLMISDIEASSRVELAGAGEPADETREPASERSIVVVEVDADGSFLIGEMDGSEGSVAADRDSTPRPPGAPEGDPAVSGPGGPGRDVVRVADPEALAEALRALAAEHEDAGRRTLVLIEPHPASAVQRTVDVMDICDRLGLDKSLRMDIEIVSGAR